MTRIQFRIIVFVVGISLFLSLLNMIMLLAQKTSVSFWFDFDNQNLFYNLISHWAGWVIVLSRLVPMQLSTALRVGRYYQSKNVRKELKEMPIEGFFKKGYPKKLPRNMVLNPNCLEDLGKVDLVMINKTGTLTLKNSVVEKMRCANQIYDENFEEENDLMSIRNEMLVKNMSLQNELGFKTREILRCLAISNSIGFAPGDISAFAGSSSDEVCFCNYAKKYGAELLNTQDKIILKTVDEAFGGIDNESGLKVQRNYNIIAHFSHNSQLERGSILVYSNTESGKNKLVLYSKGSIKGMENTISKRSNSEFEIGVAKLRKDIEFGFRISLFTRRELKMEKLLSIIQDLDGDMDTFINKQDPAKSLRILMNKMSAEQMQKIKKELELDLDFLGSTCSKERLDFQLPETFTFLKNAGITNWIVSGDSLDSCVYVSRRIGFVGSSSEVKIILKMDHPEDVSASNLSSLRNKINVNDSKRFCLAITSECLLKVCSYKDENGAAYNDFLEILFASGAAIFGEMTPIHKQQLVTLVREEQPGKTILAVGNNANDETMLANAHIGVALFRGGQYLSCRSSDLYMQKFHQIKYLIFGFGENIYRKNSKLILFCVYASILLTLPELTTSPLSYFFPRRLLPDWISSVLGFVFPLFALTVFCNNDLIFQKEEKLKYSEFYQRSSKE